MNTPVSFRLKTILFDYFERSFLELALKYEAERVSVPPVVAAHTLKIAEYFTSFPTTGVRIDRKTMLNPAVCYHLYELCSYSSINSQKIFTVQSSCFRHEKKYEDMKRMMAFTMREIVCLGDAAVVESFRRALVTDVVRFGAAIGLTGTIEQAQDPFFVSAKNRGKILLQKLHPLKYELKLEASGKERLAVASFNNHQDFFGNRFGITFKGKPARTACVAFGIERWVHCFLVRHKTDMRSWPESVQNQLTTI